MARWKMSDGSVLQLITPEEYERMEDGHGLFSIDGTFVRKGRDRVDGDTRGGHLAYGRIIIGESRWPRERPINDEEDLDLLMEGGYR